MELVKSTHMNAMELLESSICDRMTHRKITGQSENIYELWNIVNMDMMYTGPHTGPYDVMYYAIQYSDIPMIEYILNNSGIIGVVRNYLSSAIEKNDIRVLKVLLKYAGDIGKMESDDYVGSHPLYCAVFNNNLAALNVLLDHGAAPSDYFENIVYEIKGRDKFMHMTELVMAIQMRNIVEPINNNRLQRYYAGAIRIHPLRKFDEGDRIRNNQIVKRLLEAKSNPNRYYSTNRSPLAYALDTCDMELIQILLNSGANINKLSIVDRDKLRYEVERHGWNTVTLKALKFFRPVVNRDVFIKITSLLRPVPHITDPMLLIDNQKLKAERLGECELFSKGILV